MSADDVYAKHKYVPDSSDPNEMLVYTFFEKFFRKHDFSAIDEYMHPDYIQHDYDIPEGRDGFRANFKQVFEIFPQFHVNILHIVTKGDMLVLHGYGVTDPGRIEVLVCDTYRVKNGLLYEHWGTVQELPAEYLGRPSLMFDRKQGKELEGVKKPAPMSKKQGNLFTYGIMNTVMCLFMALSALIVNVGLPNMKLPMFLVTLAEALVICNICTLVFRFPTISTKVSMLVSGGNPGIPAFRITNGLMNATLNTFFMNSFMTLINVGFTPAYFPAWLHGFPILELVAIAVSFIVAPIGMKAVSKVK